jgi:hypothetical protein
LYFYRLVPQRRWHTHTHTRAHTHTHTHTHTYTHTHTHTHTHTQVHLFSKSRSARARDRKGRSSSAQPAQGLVAHTARAPLTGKLARLHRRAHPAGLATAENVAAASELGAGPQRLALHRRRHPLPVPRAVAVRASTRVRTRVRGAHGRHHVNRFVAPRAGRSKMHRTHAAAVPAGTCTEGHTPRRAACRPWRTRS